MYAGQQLQDDDGKQVCLFPLTRFFNKSTVVAEHIRTRVVQDIMQQILYHRMKMGIECLELLAMHRLI